MYFREDVKEGKEEVVKFFTYPVKFTLKRYESNQP